MVCCMSDRHGAVSMSSCKNPVRSCASAGYGEHYRLLVPRTQRLKERSLCEAVQGSGNPLTVARHFSIQLDVACTLALAPCW